MDPVTISFPFEHESLEGKDLSSQSLGDFKLFIPFCIGQVNNLKRSEGQEFKESINSVMRTCFVQVAVILQLKDVLEHPVHRFNLVLTHFSLKFWILNFKVIFEILRGLPLLLSGWGLGSCCQLKSPLVPTSTGVLGGSGGDLGMSSRNVEDSKKLMMMMKK
jgi:hypothetical protein